MSKFVLVVSSNDAEYSGAHKFDISLLSSDELGHPHVYYIYCSFNRLDSKGNYTATSNNTKLVHWPLMGGLLHLVQ